MECDRGRLQASLQWFDKAIAILQAIYAQDKRMLAMPAPLLERNTVGGTVATSEKPIFILVEQVHNLRQARPADLSEPGQFVFARDAKRLSSPIR